MVKFWLSEKDGLTHVGVSIYNKDAFLEIFHTFLKNGRVFKINDSNGRSNYINLSHISHISLEDGDET
jgi:hypothetical protein